MTLLQTVWYFLIVVLFIGYAILDGFDLGVGILHPFCRSEKARRAHLASIEPFWDGNEVWLLTAGGALFAAFPPVYACVFSGFYVAMMALVWSLILRAVSIEFRGKMDSPRWRAACDVGFFVGSAIAVLLLGVALGNILRGLPLDANGDYAGSFLDLLNPSSLLVGALAVVGAALHGALYLAARTEGDLRDAARTKARILWPVFGILAIAGAAWNVVAYPHLASNYLDNSTAWISPGACVVALVLIPVCIAKGEDLAAFLASSAAVAGYLASAAVALSPHFVVASNDPGLSLSAANASSSEKTLQIMLIITLIGLPIVLAYTAYIHYVFRGKVTVDKEGY
ncbi:cytochrome d ubiquinol oxidase subunit II [Candidatus Sumerlaeota bacterium]|nr:cytochrome d ubiquinol oxidase subunit II [Candidatus Sumerlaeota bacterium]